MPKEKLPEKEFGEILFEWKIPEFAEHKRTSLWYLVMMLLALILIIYSLFTANFLFALIIILVIFIVFLKTYTRPRNLKFKITEDGVLIGNQFFSYNDINNFYFIYDPPAVKKLFFTLKGLSPHLSIPLNNMNPLAIRERLLEYIDEDLEREHQTFEDQLETILKL